jgi:hypothetical protein
MGVDLFRDPAMTDEFPHRPSAQGHSKRELGFQHGAAIAAVPAIGRHRRQIRGARAASGPPDPRLAQMSYTAIELREVVLTIVVGSAEQ